MERKVLEPLVLNPARAGRLQKPVLVIGKPASCCLLLREVGHTDAQLASIIAAITDGSPAGEPRDQVRSALKRFALFPAALS